MIITQKWQHRRFVLPLNSFNYYHNYSANYITVADKINMLLNGLDRVQAAYSVCLFIRCVIIKSDWIMLINVSADVLKKVKYSSPR